MNLTDQEKRIKVAEACGIPLIEELGIRYKDGLESWGNSPEYTAQKCANYQRQGVGCELIKRQVPGDSDFDPQNDLNAMHGAEKVIDEQRLWYAYAYYLNLGRNGGNNHEWTKIHATAAQRFDAFGKTLNLW